MGTASLRRLASLTMLFALLVLPFVSFAQGLVFHQDGTDLNPDVDYPIRPGQTFQRYGPDCAQGEYLNLCAECVSGQTEKEDGFGTDSCGVCGGSDTCLSQCSDPVADLDEELGEDKGCMKLTSMTPHVLDLAESTNGTIYIFGEGISPETLDSVECSLKKDDASVTEVTGRVLEDKIELELPLPENEGSYALYCNSSVGADLKEMVQVVSSSSLLPMAADKPTVLTWLQTEVRLTVSKLQGPVEVICFGRDDQGTTVYREWTNSVEGNSLSSTVVCPRLTLAKPGVVHFGVAYSEGAIKTAKSVKVTGVAVSPNPVSAVFDEEERKVIVKFDQNLEESLLDSCASVFKQASLLVFGDNPECSAVANEIHVLIKDDKALANTDLEFTDNVRTKFSDMAVEGSVPVDFQQLQGRNPLRLEGEKRICGGQSTEVKVEGQQVGVPIWELHLVTRNLSAANISAGQRQRLNMIQWAVNRSSRAFPRALHINSSQMRGGQTYRVRATAKDHRGSDRQASLELRVAGRGEVWVELRGPHMLDIRGAGVYRAVLRACGPLPSPTKYTWKVVSSKGETVDTSYMHGARMFLDGGRLRPSDIYQVSVQAFQGENLLGADDMSVKTTMRGFELRLAETNLVVGTGQAVEVDASRSIDINPALLKFKWSCRKGYCFLPGKERKPLNELQTFSQPLLRLPSKSLAIGSYLLEVEALTESVKSKAQLEVRVVRGQPPYFSRLTSSEPESGRDLELQLRVSEVRGRCHFRWESVPLLGHVYLPLPQSTRTVEGSPSSAESTNLNLTIPRSSLRAGGRYSLRAVADCGRLSQSYFQFQFQLPPQFPALQLQVEPQEGKALETNFTYKVHSNDSSQNYLNYYGFEENGAVKYLFTGHETEFETILGQGTVKTVVKVCRTKSDCVTVYGPVMTISSPKEVSDDTIRRMVATYRNLLTNVDLAESKAFLQMSVPALRQANELRYSNFSIQVEHILMDRIQLYSDRLREDKLGLEESVRLLDTATNALTLLENNDDAMVEVLKFRDLIHQTNQLISEKKIETKISASLPAEPRVNHEPEIYSRKKRSPESAKEDSIKDPVKALLTLSSKVGNITNDPKKIIEEKIVLLNYLVTYATQFCNDTDQTATKEIGSDDGFSMIGSTRFKPDQLATKLPLPQCYKAHCPNITGQASVSFLNSTVSSKKSEGFCLATAFLRDDILTDVSLSNRNDTIRWGPIFWVELLPLSHGVVGPLDNYTFLVPSNRSQASARSVYNRAQVSSRGNAVLQFPLGDQKTPNGTILQCSRYENGTWNTSSCGKVKTQSKFILCRCPYPGYFSVFAVFENQTSPLPNKTNDSPVTDRNKTTTLTTVPVVTPTVLAPTTTQMKPPAPSPTTQGKPNATQILSPPTTSQSPLTVPQSPAQSPPNTTQSPPTTTLSPTTTTQSHTTAAALAPTASPVSTSTLKANATSSLPKNNATEPSANTSRSLTTESPTSDDVVPSVQLEQFKYIASFRINESYSEKAENNEDTFLAVMNKQLQTKLNLTLPTSVQPEKGVVKVTLKLDERLMREQGHGVAALAELLRNGTLSLFGLRGEQLSVPAQDLILTQTNRSLSAATTAFITVMVLFLLLLIGALISAAYLRNSRHQRCHLFSQGTQEDPPAPKYLRLHDTVSLGSSGPSTPNVDMESSLAVVTRPKSRSYNTMEQFSNLPGNI